MLFPPRAGQPGDELTWGWLNKLLKWCRRNELYAGNNSGVELKKMDCGTFIRVSGPPTNLFVGIVQSPGITARAGLTLGSGPVEIYYKDAGSGDYVDSGIQIDVDSISSTAGGVPAGTWVTCGFQADGTATLVNEDCA